MELLNQIRYSLWFSKLVRKPLKVLVTWSENLSAAARSKIKINGGDVKYYGYKLKFPNNVGMGILSNIYWQGERGFEQYTGKVLIELFKMNTIFFDVGSNFGFYSVLAKKVNGTLEVVAFEPHPVMVQQNNRFKKWNGVEYLLTPMGLSDSDSKKEFFIPEMSDNKKEVSTASFNKEFYFNKKFKSTSIEIECITLDNFYRANFRYSQHPPRLCVKIDVEGYEVAVVQGGKAFFSETRPLIVCELDSTNAQTMVEYFRSMQFEFYHIQPLGLIKFSQEDFLLNIKKYRDFLICPRERINAIEHNFIPFNRIDSFFN